MIGVDFGGTNIKISDVHGSEVRRLISIPTDKTKSALRILDDIAEAIHRLVTVPTSVGLAVPGEVDRDGRCWRLPNIPGFEGVPIQHHLSSLLECPVVVENDATAAALAELRYGHGRRYKSFIMLTLGTGIGGGVVLNGVLRRGAHGFAGELGHISIHRDESWPCVCGETGCLESYIDTKALIRKFEELGGEAKEISDIAKNARAGEAPGLGVFKMMGEILALGIRSLQCVLDVDAFVFSGGISASFDLVEPSCRSTLIERSFAKPLGEVPLLVSELGEKAGQIGAALLPDEFPQ